MMAAMEAPIRVEQLRIVPANEAAWEDLVAIFGTRDYPGRCQCQWLKVEGWIWRDSTQEERTEMLRTGTACGEPDAPATSGLVAYLDGEPVGWVAVEPRAAYVKLRTTPVPWRGIGCMRRPPHPGDAGASYRARGEGSVRGVGRPRCGGHTRHLRHVRPERSTDLPWPTRRPPPDPGSGLRSTGLAARH